MGLRASALLFWLTAGPVFPIILYSCTVQNLHGHLRPLPSAYLTYSLLYLQPTSPTPSPITTTTTTTITAALPFLFKPCPASLGLWKVEGARPSSARALRARRLQQGHERRGVGGLTELRQGVHCGGLRGRVACKRKKQKASECAVAVRARR